MRSSRRRAPRRRSHRRSRGVTGDQGLGAEFANILWAEGLFRHFDNRRQVADYTTLAPTPWQSGSINREQDVSKADSPRLRTTLIELSWLWCQHRHWQNGTRRASSVMVMRR
ncbi:transposase [Mesorhizobium sp. ORM16]|uniref:transposase n=1 Tax=Mesorhizobium sp. ORM16 TaxID=3376989 RepID=UPI00385759DE